MASSDVLERPNSASKGADKSPKAFRTISEVADEIGVPQHVLRFWESKFPEVSPVKRRGGRRYYRPEDVELLLNIKELLYHQGFTIKGARKQVAEARQKPQQTPAARERKKEAAPREEKSAKSEQSDLFSGAEADLTPEQKEGVRMILADLCEARDILKPYSY